MTGAVRRWAPARQLSVGGLYSKEGANSLVFLHEASGPANVAEMPYWGEPEQAPIVMFCVRLCVLKSLCPQTGGTGAVSVW